MRALRKLLIASLSVVLLAAAPRKRHQRPISPIYGGYRASQAGARLSSSRPIRWSSI